MGKGDVENGLDPRRRSPNDEPSTSRSSSRFFLCERCCPMGRVGGIAHLFNFKCLFVLILSLALFLSALFLLLPTRAVNSRYDVDLAIKHSARYQAYFRLHQPVPKLVPYVHNLEDDIYSEIGVPETRIAILSMHPAHSPNLTHVVFGVIPDPPNATINPVSISLLKSSMIELFLNHTNLTLTSSIFGQPSSFETLKFKGGITVIPPQPAPIWQIVQTLFNFTLNNSIYDVTVNLDMLSRQLKGGLDLRFDENVYVQVTNEGGSTIADPVIVQASVLSDTGNLQPQRMKQLAQKIRNSSSSNNLGLNYTIFGRVKSVSLSSYLEHTLQAPSPSPSLAPEPSTFPGPASSPSPAPSAYPPSPISDAIIAPGPSSLPCYGSPGSPSPSRSHCNSSTVPPQSPCAPLPPCVSMDELSPDSQPSSVYHHPSLQGQEKSGGDVSVPHTIFSSGGQYGPLPGVHVTVLVAATCHLLFWLC